MATIINGDGIVTVEGTSTTQGRVRLNEDTDNGTNYVELQAPASVPSTVTFTLPSADGTNGQIIQTNGSGVLTFANAASLATPLTVTGNSTAGAEIRLPEDTDNGSNYVALKAADNLASNVTFTLPSADGTNGQVLQTNASGTLSFANLAVANGGTGQTSLTSNNVILGNGTSAVQFVAPGTNGNILTSNGTTWQSTAPAGGGSWIRLSNSVAFSSSTLDFTGFVTSDYNTYAVVIYAYSIQSGSYGAFRFFVGGTIQTSGYSGSGFYSDASPTILARGGSSGSASQLIQLTNAANLDQAGIIFINANNFNSLTGTGIPSIISQIGGGAYNTNFYQNGSLNTTSPITGIRFYVEGGGTFAGYFNLYGIKRN